MRLEVLGQQPTGPFVGDPRSCGTRLGSHRARALVPPLMPPVLPQGRGVVCAQLRHLWFPRHLTPRARPRVTICPLRGLCVEPASAPFPSTRDVLCLARCAVSGRNDASSGRKVQEPLQAQSLGQRPVLHPRALRPGRKEQRTGRRPRTERNRGLETPSHQLVVRTC